MNTKHVVAPPRTLQGKSLLSTNMAPKGRNLRRSNLGTCWVPSKLSARDRGLTLRYLIVRLAIIIIQIIVIIEDGIMHWKCLSNPSLRQTKIPSLGLSTRVTVRWMQPSLNGLAVVAFKEILDFLSM